MARPPRTVPPAPDGASAEVARRLDRLTGLTNKQLRGEWQAAYRVPPPIRLSRDLLQRGIAYRIQEQAHGGLSQSVRRRLVTLARALTERSSIDIGASPAKAGTRLLRQWRGETHSVLVEADGFLYQGQRYRSLTEIAEVITGAHWSGPRFFGTGRSRRAPKAARG